MRHRYLYIAALSLLVVGAVALLATASGRSAQPFAFTTVTPQELAGNGVTLTAPLAALPAAAVSQADANAAASSAVQGGAVLESHYMHCVDSWARNPTIDEDCYAVSVDPASIPVAGQPGEPFPAPMKWAVVFVDSTGQVIDIKASNN
jgi:hypothetical protein